VVFEIPLPHQTVNAESFEPTTGLAHSSHATMKALLYLSLLVATVHAHCKSKNGAAILIAHLTPDTRADKFPRLVVNGKPEPSDWVSVRRTKTTNSRDNGGVSDVNSQDIRCFGGSTGKATATVAAGDSIGFVASSGIMHFVSLVPGRQDCIPFGMEYVNTDRQSATY